MPFGVVNKLKVTPPGSASFTETVVEYFHNDHLGSLIAVTDQTGTVTERRSYDAWGKRRELDGSALSVPPVPSFIAERHGYTLHEELPEAGLIHMNGRLYDPTINRFLSVDPIIQYPLDLQSYNAYSYLYNNPMNSTDPSGFASHWEGDTLVVTPDFDYRMGMSAGAIDFVMSTLSYMPVVGSSVDAYNSFNQGNVLQGSIFVALAVADVATLGSSGVITGGVKVATKEFFKEKVEKGAAKNLARKEGAADAVKGEAVKGKETIHGNSKNSEKSQHVYEIKNKHTGEVVKTGVSSGKISEAGQSYRATAQVNKWGKDDYAGTIIAEIPAGPGARQQALAIERANAEGLREAGQLVDRFFHQRP